MPMPRPKRPRPDPQPQPPPSFEEQPHQHLCSLLRSAVDLDRELVCAFWCQSGDENEVICDCKGCTVTTGSAHCLGPGKWLNDELIQCFSQHWFQTMMIL
jgi:Ulp1 family protease